MGYLTWKQHGGTHYGLRNGAAIVRVYEVNHGMTLRPDGRGRLSALFTANWDAPVPNGWWGSREEYEWRGAQGTTEERDRLFEEAKASCERTFARWASLMGLLPAEALTVDRERGDRLVTASGRLEV